VNKDYHNPFITYLLLSTKVKKIRKSINICHSYSNKKIVQFFDSSPRAYVFVSGLLSC